MNWEIRILERPPLPGIQQMPVRSCRGFYEPDRTGSGTTFFFEIVLLYPMPVGLQKNRKWECK